MRKKIKTKIKKENNFCPKVLFYATNPTLFRTTLIGNLYEVSQVYPVILLIGKVDSETEKVLYNKKLFPKLQKIIFCEEPFYGKVLIKNNRLYGTIKKAVENYKPDIVISDVDTYPGSLYLMRFAKKIGAVTIAIQSGFQVTDGENLYLWSCLMNSYLKMPNFLPFSVRLFFVKIKKYLGHFFYYWLLPLTVGETPFKGKTSFVFWKISAGLRDADYSIVFSKREYNLCIKDGVPAEKVFTLSHSLERKNTKKFFGKVYLSKNRAKVDVKTLTLMWPSGEISLKSNDYSLISEKEMQKNRVEIVALIANILKEWRIFIKPHPLVQSTQEIKRSFEFISDCVEVVEPSEPADKYIEMSNIIVGIAPSSTTLFTASLQCPEKIILSLNLNQEFLGDSYKDFNGIEYIDSEKKLLNTLRLIRDNKYCKEYKRQSESDFPNTIEMLNSLYKKSKMIKI